MAAKKNNWWIWLFVFGLIAVIGCIFLFTSSEKRFYRIQENGKYGFIDSLGNVVITPQYKYVSDFTEDGYALVISSMKSVNDDISINYGYINKKNKLVIDTTNTIIYRKNLFQKLYQLNADSLITDFNDGNLSFTASIFNELLLISDRFVYQDQKKYRFGYKNSKNEIVIPAQFLYCRPFIEDVAFVRDTVDLNSLNKQIKNEDFTDLINNVSLIDKNGKYITRAAYAFTQDFHKGKTWVKKAELRKKDNGEIDNSADLMQIDKTGKTLLGPIPTSIRSQIYNSRDNDLYLYLFEILENFVVYTYINNNGKIATNNSDANYISLDSIYQDATMFSEGYAAVRVFENNENKTPRWAFINKHFDFPNQEFYDSVLIFSNGLCPVKKATTFRDIGKWGYVDKNLNMAIQYNYDDVGIFRGALAYAKIEGNVVNKEGYINRKGEFVWSTDRKKRN